MSRVGWREALHFDGSKVAVVGAAHADEAMSSSGAAGFPIQLRDLGLGVGARIQAVDVGACIAAGGVVAIAGVVDEVRLRRADKVS